MQITNRFGLPDTIVRAVKNDDYSRGESRKSVSQLINSPRIDILRKRHYAQLKQDASDLIWPLLGKGIHKALEKGVTEEHISEERLFMEVEGWVISGALDIQHIDGSTTESGRQAVKIQDYKVCSYQSVISPKPDWERQQNSYATILEHVKPEYEVISLEIVAIIRDWSRHRARADKAYPQSPIMMLSLPLWAPDVRLAYLKERVRLHQEAEASAALGEDLPECSDEDMWATETTFAIKKQGGKRAIKITDNFLDAVDQVNASEGKLVLETRPGRRVRCSGNYCSVAQHCDQYQKHLADHGLDPLAEDDE